MSHFSHEREMEAEFTGDQPRPGTPELFAEYREGGEFEPFWDKFSRAFDATFERIHLEIRPFDPHL